jgi:L-aspartate oxidase
MDRADVIIVGAGLAGLSSALYLAEKCPHSSLLIMDKHEGSSSNTRLAQGGIAAVTDLAFDSMDSHIADTLAAGRGKNDLSIVRQVITKAPDIIQDLLDWGVEFDKDSLQRFKLGLEGGHSFPRIIHHKDKTGQEIILKLRRRIQRYPSISFSPYCVGVDLLAEKNQYQGIKAFFPKKKKIELLRSSHLILATGGSGQVFQATSNPTSATGDGLAMAIRAGAKVADLAHFQFHPTALFHPGAVRNLLITEALRGAGAFVVNNKGERFLFSIDPRGELATRDIVTQGIMEEMGKNDVVCVYLDARHLGKEKLLSDFPQVYENCLLEGYDLSKNTVPIIPAAHYQCGGIKVNRYGQTSIRGIFAVGECACTGLHGANRLASNSLPEALVFAKEIASFIAEPPAEKQAFSELNLSKPPNSIAKPTLWEEAFQSQSILKKYMSRLYLGAPTSSETKMVNELIRSHSILVEKILAQGYISEALLTYRNMLTVSYAMINAFTRHNDGTHNSLEPLNSPKIL